MNRYDAELMILRKKNHNPSKGEFSVKMKPNDKDGAWCDAEETLTETSNLRAALGETLIELRSLTPEERRPGRMTFDERWADEIRLSKGEEVTG